jgi:hypothetical protein
MSRHSGGSKRREQDIPQEDWEQFVRDNAVVLVRQRDALIARLRKRITLLEKASENRRRHIRDLKGNSP